MTTVHILATCRNPDLWHATELVFKSIRVGFPTASIRVQYNRLNLHQALYLPAPKPLLDFTGRHVDTTHWEWIQSLVETEQEPFWICDTDIVFWNSMEQWTPPGFLWGRLIPDFREEFTGARYQNRLHTSLMYIDPVELRQKISAYYKNHIPVSWFTSNPDLFRPQLIPQNGDTLFFDTCAMLYHAVGGWCFFEEHLNCYDHLHGACSADIIGPHMTDGRKVEHDKMACLNPEAMWGSWKQHDEYFKSRKL